ncbi:hypothetical protein QE152_g12795 [Popillia japonica]|uniref:Uncharacterized protein n=1 Tax=Popillia japonica TaxID=7064 RepID=A0AAW1LHH9_POPJA
MLHTSGHIFLSAATLFFNSNVTNNLTNYTPEYLPASFFFYNSNASSVLKPVEGDEIFFDSTLFPRCCQPKTLYDIDNKGCLAGNDSSAIYEDLGINIDLLQSGLVFCKVVVDRFVETKNFRLEDGNATLMIDGDYEEREKFCIDKTLQLDDVYVVRLCKNVSCCSSVNKNKKKERCVHKCCNDGFQSIDYKCSLNDRMGIHVKNYSDVYARIGKPII